jgi:hypothetical protein
VKVAVCWLSVLALAACAASPLRHGLSGRYAANAEASVLLPGDETPRDFVLEIEDDGTTFATTQAFTATSGEPVRLSWRGACDGTVRPVEGSFVEMQMSCRRSADGAVISTIAVGPMQYDETCRLKTSQRLVCEGEAPGSDRQAHRFSYAFDRL